MPEGLYRPADIELPAPVRAALPAVVRVLTSIRFRVTVHPSQAACEAARAAPGAYDVIYQASGVIWPVQLSAEDLLALRANALAALQPGRFEMLAATADLDLAELRAALTRTTDELAGSASGFLVGHHAGRALIATNHHVAREAIGRTGRTGGQRTFAPVAVPDLRVGVGAGSWASKHAGLVQDVHLVAGASHDDWKRGLDWALLGIPASALDGVQPLRLEPQAQLGEAVWGLGFPVRSRRLGRAGYLDADDTLRVSQGALTRREPGAGRVGWRADLDGLSGSSGSAVLNRSGAAVGICRNHTHFDDPPTGPVDRRLIEYGGEAQLAPVDGLMDVLDTQRA